MLEIAMCGTKMYRKTLAFVPKRYNLDKMECKESGTTNDNAIEYACVEMFKHLSKLDSNNEDDTTNEEATNTSEDNIVEADNELIEEMILETVNEQCPQQTES